LIHGKEKEEYWYKIFESSSKILQAFSTVGTPDYIAPEGNLDFYVYSTWNSFLKRRVYRSL
jgi:hypothetical protein